MTGTNKHLMKSEINNTDTWVSDFESASQDILARFFSGSVTLVSRVSSIVSIISSDTIFLEPLGPKTDLEDYALYCTMK